MTNDNNNLTLGEICAGIGGFSAGFEQAGWSTKWQLELDDVNRAVLADRFPAARQFKNLLDWMSGAERLKYMGFSGDWMRPTLRRLMVPEMPCPPPWQNGSLKF